MLMILILLKIKREGKLLLPYKPVPYQVIAVKGSMITAKQKLSNHVITRNCTFFKHLDSRRSLINTGCNNNDSDINFPYPYSDVENTADNFDVSDRRYPLRTRRRPTYLENYV